VVFLLSQVVIVMVVVMFLTISEVLLFFGVLPSLGLYTLGIESFTQLVMMWKGTTASTIPRRQVFLSVASKIDLFSFSE
jgi:hypothetical protein